jgi:hypothetical protein
MESFTNKGTRRSLCSKNLFRRSFFFERSPLFADAVNYNSDRNTKIILLLPERLGLQVIGLDPQREPPGDLESAPAPAKYAPPELTAL